MVTGRAVSLADMARDCDSVDTASCGFHLWRPTAAGRRIPAKLAADMTKGRHTPPVCLIHTMRTLVISAGAAAMLVLASSAHAASTGFDPRIIAFGEAREQIKSTPMLDRPYRPLHVYGNTARRRHNRGAQQLGR